MNVLRMIFLASFVIPVLGHAQTSDPCLKAPESCATLINTRASSHTRIPNSAVDVSVGISATDRDLPAVQRSLAQKSTSLLTFLRAQQAQRLITTQVSFEPQMKTDKNGPDKTVGYTGTLAVAFRTTPEKAPDLLSGVLSNGANTIDSTVFTPTEEEIAAARRELASTATLAAISQAESVAKAAGMHIVAMRQINVENESSINPRPFNLFSKRSSIMANDAPMAPVQTSAGDQEVSLGVNLTAAATR